MQSTRYSCQILIKLEFFDRFFKNTQISTFMKMCPVWAEFFADGQTYRCDEANSHFLQFWKCP